MDPASWHADTGAAAVIVAAGVGYGWALRRAEPAVRRYVWWFAIGLVLIAVVALAVFVLSWLDTARPTSTEPTIENVSLPITVHATPSLDAEAKLVELTGKGSEPREGQRAMAGETAAIFAPRRAVGEPNMLLAEAGTAGPTTPPPLTVHHSPVGPVRPVQAKGMTCSLTTTAGRWRPRLWAWPRCSPCPHAPAVRRP